MNEAFVAAVYERAVEVRVRGRRFALRLMAGRYAPIYLFSERDVEDLRRVARAIGYEGPMFDEPAA